MWRERYAFVKFKVKICLVFFLVDYLSRAILNHICGQSCTIWTDTAFKMLFVDMHPPQNVNASNQTQSFHENLEHQNYILLWIVSRWLLRNFRVYFKETAGELPERKSVFFWGGHQNVSQMRPSVTYIQVHFAMRLSMFKFEFLSLAFVEWTNVSLKQILISAFNMFPLGRIGLQMLIYGAIYAPFFFWLSAPLFTGWRIQLDIIFISSVNILYHVCVIM